MPSQHRPTILVLPFTSLDEFFGLAVGAWRLGYGQHLLSLQCPTLQVLRCDVRVESLLSVERMSAIVLRRVVRSSFFSLQSRLRCMLTAKSLSSFPVSYPGLPLTTTG